MKKSNLKESIRMQQLADLLTESQIRRINSILNEKISWDEIDKKMESERIGKIEDANAYIKTPQGINAVKVISNLISKPYGTEELREVLEILNINSQKFQYAAKAAGMDFSTGGQGITIYDDNYQDQDVSIEYMKGEWYVG
jgi:hypothetical protein